MNNFLFNFPKQALYGRTIPKNKLYEHAKPNSSTKQKIIEQIDKIIWQYKLAPETVNLPANHDIAEIEVFNILLKSSKFSEDVLECIDNAIPFPIIYQVIFQNQIKSVASFKQCTNKTKNTWTVTAYFETPWIPLDTIHVSLPVSLDLAGLYEQILRRHIDIPPREGETLIQQVERIKQIQYKQNEYRKVERHLQKEKQFNRKVEFNAQLRKIKAVLDELLN